MKFKKKYEHVEFIYIQSGETVESEFAEIRQISESPTRGNFSALCLESLSKQLRR